MHVFTDQRRFPLLLFLANFLHSSFSSNSKYFTSRSYDQFRQNCQGAEDRADFEAESIADFNAQISEMYWQWEKAMFVRRMDER